MAILEVRNGLCISGALVPLEDLLDVEQKKLKIRKKTKIRKGDLKEKRREETNKNEKGLMNKNFVIEDFDVFPFMKQNEEETKRKKETKTKNHKKAKNKDKKEGRKERTRERERERETEKEKVKKGGGQKRLWRKKGRESKKDKRCPF